jgi:CMP/dCMP kinase
MNQETDNAHESSGHLVIGVEGPAAAGKSTMAMTVGHEMGIPVIEGGRFYRQLTYLALQADVDPSDTEQLSVLAREMPARFNTSIDGTTITLDGEDVSTSLHEDTVSKMVGKVAQNLDVRKIIDQQIIDRVNSEKKVIIVGRHLKKFYPDASVLYVTIDPDEADNRHKGRAGSQAQSVSDRNEADAKTANLLGMSNAHEATVDVTSLGPEEQASLLKNFILSQQSK